MLVNIFYRHVIGDIIEQEAAIGHLVYALYGLTSAQLSWAIFIEAVSRDEDTLDRCQAKK